MNSTTSTLTERLKKFFESLHIHIIQMSSSSIIVVIVLYLGVNVGLAELVRQSSYKMHMLASEPLIESGPDFVEASREHAEMVQVYVEHIEQRQLAAILWLLYTEYSLKNQFHSVWLALKDAPVDEKGAMEVIWVVRKRINEFYGRAEKFSRRPNILFISEHIPRKLLRHIDNTLAKSHELVGKFEKELLLENAPVACETDRKTMILLFLARSSYNNQKRLFDSFGKIVGKYVKCK